MKPKSKTVWEQWVEKVEAAWPITATEIAFLLDIDHKTATRVRDHVAESRQAARRNAWKLAVVACGAIAICAAAVVVCFL